MALAEVFFLFLWRLEVRTLRLGEGPGSDYHVNWVCSNRESALPKGLDVMVIYVLDSIVWMRDPCARVRVTCVHYGSSATGESMLRPRHQRLFIVVDRIPQILPDTHVIQAHFLRRSYYGPAIIRRRRNFDLVKQMPRSQVQFLQLVVWGLNALSMEGLTWTRASLGFGGF